jgi:4-amino-4-deoxy-L-arabinose transferase-like glycosyltransferase
MNVPQPCKDSETNDASRLDLLACVVIVTFLIFLAWFGAEFHYVEMCYSTEYDRYVEKADQLRQGLLSADHYHGLLYPILAAAMGMLLGDTFTAARTVSTLSAGGLLFLTYLIGARCFGRKVALLAITALALNSLVAMCGFEAATDMLSAFLGLACLLLSMRLLERPSTLTIAGLGVCFSLAYFTRYTAVAILPCLCLALWLCPFPSNRRRLLAALTLAVTVLICLSPHFAINTFMFGGPFNTRAVDSLTTKLFLHEGKTFAANPWFPGMTGFMMAHPVPVALSFIESLKDWTVYGLAGFVAGNGIFPATLIFSLALLGGVVASVRRTDRRVALLLMYTASYFGVMCLFLVTMPRFFLPILPPCMLLAVHFMTPRKSDKGYSWKRAAVIGQGLAIVVFLILLPIGAYHALSAMLPRHPYQELEAARTLERAAGKNIVVAGTFPFMRRYVGYRYFHLTSDFGNKGPHESLDYFRKLGPVLKADNADYVIVGAPSLGSRPMELLTGQNLPGFLQPELVEGNLSVYRVLKDRL